MEYLAPIFNSLHQFSMEVLGHIPNMIVSIIFLLITYFFIKLVNHIVWASLTRLTMQSNLVIVFQKLTTVGIWFLSILIVAAIIFPSVTTANLLATLGLTSVAIGFAFKDIFENFIAGILILLRQPFHMNDYIITKDQQGGYVEKISVRNTHIRQSDGVRTVIPNALLFTNSVQVITDLDLRRTNVICSVNFDENIDQVRNAIENAIKKSKTVSTDKYFQIYIKSFSSNGVDFDIYWWTQSKPSDIRRSKDEVLSNIIKIFNEENIKLTYSTTISFQEPLFIKSEKIKKPSDESKMT